MFKKLVKHHVDMYKFIVENGDSHHRVLLHVVLGLAALGLFIIAPLWLYLLITSV